MILMDVTVYSHSGYEYMGLVPRRWGGGLESPPPLSHYHASKTEDAIYICRAFAVNFVRFRLGELKLSSFHL